MDKHCNIIRDLMPLVIDEAASEESAQCVQEHLIHCAECRACFETMQSTSADLKAHEEEQKTFEIATQKLKKKRRMRIMRNVLIGMLIGCLLSYGGLLSWSYLTQHYTQLVYHGLYGVTLSRLSNQQVSVNIDYYGHSMTMMTSLKETEENGRSILYVYAEKPVIARTLPSRNYSCTRLAAEQMNALDEIRQGLPEEYVVIWQKGDSIAAASAEMERYFALQEEYQAIWATVLESADGKAIYRSAEDRERSRQISEEMSQIAVPEWQ